MNSSRITVAVSVAAALVTGAAGATFAQADGSRPAAARAATPVKASTLKVHPRFFARLDATPKQRQALNPPAPPCPEAGLLPSTPVTGNCGLGEMPATGLPVPGNMAYWGGKVQTTPHVYLVFFGWGQRGAFGAKRCRPEPLNEAGIKATLKCDPDGAGKRMADFVSQLGGTKWAGVQKQYTQKVHGVTTAIKNPRNQLAGIWADDTNKTSSKISYTDMAMEAQRAAAHFHVAAKDLINANFVIAQPEKFSDPAAAADGYCAFHDYTQHGLEGGIYNKVRPGLVYTNMPYLLGQGSGCGANLVNRGAAGALDGYTIALGHEIEEAVTDPGAEDILPDGTQLGGWYDPFDSDENGDKCAYVGDNLGLTDPSGMAVPGGASNITGNRGGKFPVQSLWSNRAAGGVGYCAGTAYGLTP